MTPGTTRSTSLAAVALVAVVALAGCSSGGDEHTGTAPAAMDGGGQAESGDDAANAPGTAGTVAREDESTDLLEPAVISTAEVSLRSDDVAAVRSSVHDVVRRFGGQIDEDATETDVDGTVSNARLVVRIPTADFTDAVSKIEEAAELVSSHTHHETVTTEVIDVAVKVRAQRRSIERIEELLDRAGSIKEIVQVEGELTRRQAELASLEQRQKHLADQTSMSTIAVTVWRPDQPQADVRRTGFVGGLSSGWDALTASAVVLVTVVGVVLPWLPVLALVLVPGWLWWRRQIRPDTSARTPSAASADQDRSTE